MFRSLAVVGAVVAVIVVLNYRAPQDPVPEIDPAPVAAQVATVALFPVLLPTDEGWRPTAARWEPTPESQGEPVWFTGGVYSETGPFASVSQSVASSEGYLAEQTGQGSVTGETSVVTGAEWQRYESTGERSLVLVGAGSTTVVSGTGSWADLERFAASLEPVAEPASETSG
jgi:hypothetical protein